VEGPAVFSRGPSLAENIPGSAGEEQIKGLCWLLLKKTIRLFGRVSNFERAHAITGVEQHHRNQKQQP
jgi:hypothetical protein